MIEVKGLSFSYSRGKSFINDMSFQVNKGEIFGFLGPSGAGKSTVQKILTGIIKNYGGSVSVLGKEMRNQKRDFYQNIGVDFEFPNLYSKFSAMENLKFFSSLYDRPCHDPMELLERVGLANDADKKVSGFSKGMKMRLGFIRSILNKPQLIFLDEPTSGLDPSNARTIKNMIVEQKQAGNSVLLTTHNMHDAEELCDRVAFIVDGEIKVIDTPDSLKLKKGSSTVKYAYSENNTNLTSVVPLKDLYKNADFMKKLSDEKIISIHTGEPNLEDIFIELTGRSLA